MKSRRLLQQAFGLTLVVLLLAGCGAASVKPQAGATLTGPLEQIDPGKNGTIGSGELAFTISEDGTGISSVTLALSDMNCSNESGSIKITSSGQSSTTTLIQPAAITNGKFELDIGGSDEEIKIEGQFTSPTEANGTVQISTTSTIALVNETIICDYGSWNWSGEVK